MLKCAHISAYAFRRRANLPINRNRVDIYIYIYIQSLEYVSSNQRSNRLEILQQETSREYYAKYVCLVRRPI